MTASSYLQPSLAPTNGTVPEAMRSAPTWSPNTDGPSFAREERADTRWLVRVVLSTDTSAAQTIRVIVDDRDTRRIVLHTTWSNWRDVPILAAHVPSGTLLNGTVASAARELADALLAALQRDAGGSLNELGTPIASRPIPQPGPQERAALRNTRDATVPFSVPQPEKRQR